MKIIDAINKINKEEKFRFKLLSDGDIYKYIGGSLYNETVGERAEWIIDNKWLNQEIEIIEEEPKVQVELTEKEYLEYLDKQIEYMEKVKNYKPNPSYLSPKEEKKIPEKLKSLNNVGNSSNIVEFEDKQQLNNHLLKDKINEIIDYLKSKGE